MGQSSITKNKEKNKPSFGKIELIGYWDLYAITNTIKKINI